MLYETPKALRSAKCKSLLLFGMSGVGKTRAAALLREQAHWYHYSVDYRIGTRYLDEQITDSIKLEAMRIPLLRDLLRSDSIVLRSKVAFNNLTPLSKYLGAPGNPDHGGLTFKEYCRRQSLHAQAERRATEDAEEFITRARSVYGYSDFVCDSSGSLCELAEPDDPGNPMFARTARTMLPVYIEASPAHRKKLLQRFEHRPKPMYFHPDFLQAAWKEFLGKRSEQRVNPTDFLVFGFKRLMDWRLPRYRALAQRWGVQIAAGRLAEADGVDDILGLLAEAIERKTAAGSRG